MEFIGCKLKIKFISKEIKKNNKRKMILFLIKYLFSLKFKKKLTENKRKNKLIIKFPKIKLIGKNVKIIKKNLSLFSIPEKFFIKFLIINFGCGGRI